MELADRRSTGSTVRLGRTSLRGQTLVTWNANNVGILPAMNKLKLVWWLLNLCLLAAGVVAIGYAAVVSKGEDLLISMAVTKHDEKSRSTQKQLHQLFNIDTINPFYSTVGTFTGACLLASFLLSIVAITRPVYRNKLLIAFNWTLVVNMCVATAVSKADLDLLSQC